MSQEDTTIKNTFWIDWIQLFLIGLTAPFFLFPSMKYIWIFLVIPGIWICRRIVKKCFFERTILDWAVVILIIQVLATCIIVPDLAFSLPKIAGILFGVAFFYSITALMTSEKLIKSGLIVFLSGGLTLSFVGLLGLSKKLYSKYIYSLFEVVKKIPSVNFNLPGAKEGFNPNVVAGTLILTIPLFLIFTFSNFLRKKQPYLFYKNRFFFIFLLLGLIATSVVLLLTQSRGSWIGLIFSIWILLFIGWRKKKLALILMLFFIVAFLILFSFNKIPYKAKEINRTIVVRTHFWKLAIDSISNHPFFGIGMNRIRQIPSVGYETAHVHNHLMHTAAELGLPGLIAYLAILIGAGNMCFKLWSKSNIYWMRISAVALGCGQLAHFIFGFTDSIPLGAKVGIFFWFSIGLIAAMYNYMLKKSKQL